MKPVESSRRLSETAGMLALNRAIAFCACCVCGLLLYGCPLSIMGHGFPGPQLQSLYAHDVQIEAKLTDGSSENRTLEPCGTAFFFGYRAMGPGWKRTVFVDKLTVRRDGVLLARFDGEDVEAATPDDEDANRFAVIDETGLRLETGRRQRDRILNTLAEDVQLRVVHTDGTDQVRTWRACEARVWFGGDIGPGDRRRVDVARLLVTRDGEVLQDLDRQALTDAFRRPERPSRDYRPWRDMVLLDESGLRLFYWMASGAEPDIQSLCASAGSDEQARQLQAAANRQPCPAADPSCSNLARHALPAPAVRNLYPHDVQYEIKLTDGSLKTATCAPCGSISLFHHQIVPKDWRAVFVDEMTVRRDGVVLARFDGEAVEAAANQDEDASGIAVTDEAGLRPATRGGRCVRILNTLAEDLQARVVYEDGSQRLRTWPACQPQIWSGQNIARLDVTRDGEALPALRRRGFDDALKKRPKRSRQHRNGPWRNVVLVDESGFKRFFWLEEDGLDVRTLCASADAA